jgi:hypothetical protein
MHTYKAISPTNSTIKTLQVANIIGYIFMVVMNFLANWLPLGGNTTGELSDKYSNLFVPSGPTFSIWGVIYLILLGFTIYQASTLFSSKPSRVNTLVRQLGLWYFASSVLNGLWIVAWHYELLPVSVAIMWLLLFNLLMANFGISNIDPLLTKKVSFLAKSAFGIYLGWISVATIANMTTWLTAIQWRGGLEQDTWAVLMILIGAAVSAYAASRLVNGYLSLAVVWAFVGIVSKRLDAEPVYYSIAFVAGALALVLLVLSLVQIRKEFKYEKEPERHPSPLYE